MKKPLRNALLTLVIAPALFVLSNCAGYQLGSSKPAAYKDINKIFVPTFENQTLEPRVSTLVTNSVIKRLQSDGTFSLSTKESADAVLVGKIKRIERTQLRAARTDTLKTTELQVYIVVEWSLQDPVTGERIEYAASKNMDDTSRDSSTSLRNRPGLVIGRTIQFLDPNFQTSERNAIPVAAEDAANTLVSQMADGW